MTLVDFACKTFSLEQIVQCGFGLTKGELKMFMHMLSFKQSLTSKSLARALKLDESTVQRSVKKFVSLGLVTRTQQNFSSGGYQYVYVVKSRDEISRMILHIIDKWHSKVKQELDNWIM